MPIKEKLPALEVQKTAQAYNITITSIPQGADVYVSGEKIGTTPLQYYFDPSIHHDIVLKKKGYRQETDVVSAQVGKLIHKNYSMVKGENEKAGKISGIRKWLLYRVLGGGVAYAAMNKKEKEKKSSLSITILIPN